MIRVVCQHCGQGLRFDPTRAPQGAQELRIRCPKCGKPFTALLPEEATAHGLPEGSAPERTDESTQLPSVSSADLTTGSHTSAVGRLHLRVPFARAGRVAWLRISTGSRNRRWLAIVACTALLFFLAGGALIFFTQSSGDPETELAIQQTAKARSRLESRVAEREQELEFYRKGTLVRKLTLSRVSLGSLRGRLGLFYARNNRPPSRAEARAVLGPLPQELFSNSGRLHFERNNKGGWYYNDRYGSLCINSDEDVGTLKASDL